MSYSCINPSTTNTLGSYSNSKNMNYMASNDPSFYYVHSKHFLLFGLREFSFLRIFFSKIYILESCSPNRFTNYEYQNYSSVFPSFAPPPKQNTQISQSYSLNQQPFLELSFAPPPGNAATLNKSSTHKRVLATTYKDR